MSDPSLDEVLAAAENPAYVRVATARILLRQDLIAKHAALEAELAAAIARDATVNERDRAPEVAKQIEVVEAEIDEAKVEFRFRNIGRRAWADLLAKHPPTKEQAKTHRVDHNPETFPLAAIAASCTAPEGIDLAAVKRLEAAITDAQFTALWRACVDANMGGVEDPKSVTAGSILQMSERSGRTAANAGSLAQPS